MAADPGPLALVDSTALQPFPIGPSFEGLVADRLGGIAGADAGLANTGIDATSDPPDDVEPLYASTVGAAAEDAANEDAGAPESPVPQLVDAGENADAIRKDSARYLPPADAPIEQNFTTPPNPPDDMAEPGGVEQRNPPPEV